MDIYIGLRTLEIHVDPQQPRQVVRKLQQIKKLHLLFAIVTVVLLLIDFVIIESEK